MKPVLLPFLFAAAGTLASFAAAHPENAALPTRENAETRLALSPFSPVETHAAAQPAFPPDALRRVVREKTIRGENGEEIIRFRVDAEYFANRPALNREIFRSALPARADEKSPADTLPPEAAVDRFIADEAQDCLRERALTGAGENGVPAIPHEILSSARIFGPVGDVAPACVFFWRFAGGAHGIGGFACRNFSLSEERELRLADVFEKGSAPVLLKALEKNDPRRGNADFSRGESGGGSPFPSKPEPTENFLVLRDGLLFVYNHYDLDCYAAGIIVIFVPYAEISETLRADFSERIRRSRRAEAPADAAR